MNALNAPAREALSWRNGIGFLDLGQNAQAIYNLGYWQEYAQRAATAMGKTLTANRVQLVNRFVGHDAVCDIGIGSGAFITQRGGETFGYDVNPVAVAWLHQHDRWINPYLVKVDHATFWDSLEHIRDPGQVLGDVRRHVFIATPIYRDRGHCLGSKHFKPGEHCWYWTHDGLVRFMDVYGFSYIEHSDVETQLGREDVGTYVFRRSDA
ncbi:MAG: class I SAM-dependent methyltransferase [Acidimicrobiia bacterium]